MVGKLVPNLPPRFISLQDFLLAARTCYLRKILSKMEMIASPSVTVPKILYSGSPKLVYTQIVLTSQTGTLTVKVVMDFRLAHWEREVRLQTYRIYC
jgi:hypothetical protein